MSYTKIVVTDTARKEWDGETRTFTMYDLDGNLLGSRPFTDSEIALADAIEAKEMEDQNRPTVEERVEVALATNNDFLSIAPVDLTQADLARQVRALSKQNNALILLVLRKFNDITSTE